MGELRDSIMELQKQVAAAAKMSTALAEKLDDIDQRAIANMSRLEAGCDTLWLYVKALFERTNRRVEDFGNDTLAQHADSEVALYLKGIDAAAADLMRTLNEFTAIKGKLPAEYQRIDGLVANIRRNIDKKRAKLIQSKKYKAKIDGYDKALGELVTSINGRRNALQDVVTVPVKVVADLRVQPNTSLKQLTQMCTLGVKQGLADMKSSVEKGRYVSRKFRENGDLQNAFAQMKQWAGEADSMDQEVINLDPTAVKPIKDIRIFEGSRLIGTAPKAVFQGKRPMEITPVTWQKNVDVLKLLQQKVTIKASYESGDGELVNDMKVNGIKDKTVKLA